MHVPFIDVFNIIKKQISSLWSQWEALNPLSKFLFLLAVWTKKCGDKGETALEAFALKKGRPVQCGDFGIQENPLGILFNIK